MPTGSPPYPLKTRVFIGLQGSDKSYSAVADGVVCA